MPEFIQPRCLLENIEAVNPATGEHKCAAALFDEQKIKDAMLLVDVQRAVSGSADIIRAVRAADFSAYPAKLKAKLLAVIHSGGSPACSKAHEKGRAQTFNTSAQKADGVRMRVRPRWPRCSRPARRSPVTR